MVHGNDKPQLLGLARRRAFETYLRYGHRPEPAGPESKAITPSKKPPSKPARFYVWRAVRDDRVRATHALRDGQVFAWDEPPPDGHPGSEHNCRC